MKKLFTLTFVFSLCTAALLLTFSACKKESSSKEPDLTGNWLGQTKAGDIQLLYFYKFKSDHSFEHTFSSNDLGTKKVITAPIKTAGKYQVKWMNADLYSLITINDNRTDTITISFNAKKTVFSVSFDCPIYANCNPSPVYYKQ